MTPSRSRRTSRRPRARRSSLALDFISACSAKALQQFVAGLPDVAGAQSNHHIIGLSNGESGLHRRVDGAGIFGAPVAKGPDALRYLLRGHALNRLFRSGIDISDEDIVGLMERTAEFVQQGLRPRVSVRLKQRDHSRKMALARGCQRGPDLRRMMAVVVDYGDSVRL